MKKNKQIFTLRLKESRKKAGFTQKSLADLLKITSQAVQKYEDESSDVYPSTENLWQISDILNISLDWLFGKDEVEPEREPEKPPILTVDDALDLVISKLISDKLSDDAKEEIKIRIKGKILEEKNWLDQKDLLERIANSARSPDVKEDDSSDIPKAAGGKS